MSRIFDGIRVIDMTNNIAGPTATSYLADHGADVIKIEKPKYGDDNRGYGPFVEGKGISGMWYNRSKKSIVINTKDPKGVELIKELIKDADVFVESFRPGFVKKIGLNYEEVVQINPDIIMCSVSAFGQVGPYSKLPGYDLIAQAMSGAMSLTGNADGPPMKLGTAMGDFCGGFNAFGAISAALYYRERTGQGQYIDIALLDGLIIANEFMESGLMGFDVTRSGNHHSLLAPFGLFKGKHDSLIIGAASEKIWASLCKLLDKDIYIDDPDYKSSGLRVNQLDNIILWIETWLARFDDIEDAITLLNQAGIPNAKVNNIMDLIDDEHFNQRGIISELETPELSSGKIKSRGVHLKFSKTPGMMGPSPSLGQDTDDILGRLLNYGQDEIDVLRESRVVE